MTTSEVLDLSPIEGERLTAAEFIELVRTNPGIIKHARIVSPRLGRPDFGAFEVTYSRPIYKTSGEARRCLDSSQGQWVRTTISSNSQSFPTTQFGS